MKSDYTYNGNNSGSRKGSEVWTINGDKHEEKVYSYEEALTLTGTGRYNVSLGAVVSLSIISMGLDMFGFSIVIAGSTCDLQLDINQRSILLSMPFIGPIIMSYIWGYISDTRGRRKSLLIAMSGSYIASTISAFSPNWTVLAVLKFVSTSFCSCAQSAAYALLGESCCERVRGKYMLVMTSTLMIAQGVYFVLGYFILNLSFSINLGVITFVPWRLLVLILALPLALSAINLTFFYESPKFLLNAGQEERALDVLKCIRRRNGGSIDNYQVKKLVLDENDNVKREEVPLLQSLWEQTAPLFKPPLLWRTLQLYYLTAILYGTGNSFGMWFPFIVDAFYSGVNSISDEDQPQGLCNMILSSQNNNVTSDTIPCTSTLELQTVLSSIAFSSTLTIANLAISQFSSRKKALMIVVMLLASISGLIATLAPENISSFIFFIGFLLHSVLIGVLFSYFIELYPTTYRGMVACLAVAVARGSALAGINLAGPYILTHCSTTFYVWIVYLFSGVLVACFLPPDRPKEVPKV